MTLLLLKLEFYNVFLIFDLFRTFTTVFTVGEYDRTSNSAWVQFNVRDSLAKWLAGMPTSSRRIGLIIEAVHSGYSADFSLLSSTDSSVNWVSHFYIQKYTNCI